MFEFDHAVFAASILRGIVACALTYIIILKFER